MSEQVYEKKIGGLHVNMTAKLIRFSPAGDPSKIVSLDAGLMEELIEFLQGFKPERAVERMGFRVPISLISIENVDHLLHVKVQSGCKMVDVAPLNLSLSGIMYGRNEADAVSVGEKLTIELSLGKEKVALESTVRRIEGQLVGASFDEAMCGAEMEPPEDLIHIVRQLEADWIKQRAADR